MRKLAKKFIEVLLLELMEYNNSKLMFRRFVSEVKQQHRSCVDMICVICKDEHDAVDLIAYLTLRCILHRQFMEKIFRNAVIRLLKLTNEDVDIDIRLLRTEIIKALKDMDSVKIAYRFCQAKYESKLTVVR